MHERISVCSIKAQLGKDKIFTVESMQIHVYMLVPSDQFTFLRSLLYREQGLLTQISYLGWSLPIMHTSSTLDL